MRHESRKMSLCPVFMIILLLENPKNLAMHFFFYIVMFCVCYISDSPVWVCSLTQSRYAVAVSWLRFTRNADVHQGWMEAFEGGCSPVMISERVSVELGGFFWTMHHSLKHKADSLKPWKSFHWPSGSCASFHFSLTFSESHRQSEEWPLFIQEIETHAQEPIYPPFPLRPNIN